MKSKCSEKRNEMGSSIVLLAKADGYRPSESTESLFRDLWEGGAGGAGRTNIPPAGFPYTEICK